MAFCEKFSLTPLPAAPETLQLFLEFLLTTYASPKSALNAITSIKTLHHIANADASAFDSFVFSLSKRAVLHTVRHSPKRAPPLPPSLLSSLISVSLPLGPQGVAFAALISVAYNSLARLSSLVPDSPSMPDVSRVPLISDLLTTSTGFGINLKWTKTLQASDQAVVLPLIAAPLSPACAVTRLSSLLSQLRGAPPTTPLFAWPIASSGGTVYQFFTIRLARSWLSALLTQCASPGDKYSFHSFRRGGATSAFGQGASLDEVKALGTWSSDAALLYIPQALARQRAAQKLTASLR